MTTQMGKNKGKEKKLLFSITKKDFTIETFCSGGPGGQHQNKTESGVRIRHIESGAVGESRDERSQHQNKRLALERLVSHPLFKKWHELKCILVDEEIQTKNIKYEIKDENGNWIEVKEEDIKK